MSDDERRDPPPPPEDGGAGEHELPPPATWAGRKRAEGGAEPEDEVPEPDETPEPDEAPEPEETPEPEEPQGPETEAYDAIEADLDRELAGLEGDEAVDDGGEEPSAELEATEPPSEEPAVEEQPSEEAPVSSDTVEAETVALADREQAEEAALAGLRARVGAPEGGDSEPPPPADRDDNGKAPRARPVWARFLAASLVIVISMAAATSISILLYLTDIAKGLSDNEKFASLQSQLTDVDGGDPQTILIIGSDKRQGMKGDPGRSDTTILLRVDPEKHAIALLSIPRDLKVNIPGYGVGKFNEAFADDGPDKTLEVVRNLTGLKINHVVNIDFRGFADAVDAIGCVYIDVDRHYYIPPDTGVAEIDIEAGYQRMCGYNALQYVRFRHLDNDLVRAARQQDFLREARQKLPPGVLIRDRDKLLNIFTQYTTSDISDAVPLLELLKTFLGVQSAPVREVHFPAKLGEIYVTADDEAIKKAVAQFLDTEGTPGDRPAGQPPPNEQQSNGGGNGDKENKPKPDSGDHFEGPPMDDSTEQGQRYAHQVSIHKKHDGDQMIDFPVYYPTRLAPGSLITEDTRAFPIDGPEKDVFYGYKMVVDVPGDTFGHGLYDEFYGISGTDWVDAPILANPSETRTIDGRTYLLFYDGDRLRLVGWKTPKAAYWVNNTLLQSLDEGQMLSIATSMREYESK